MGGLGFLVLGQGFGFGDLEGLERCQWGSGRKDWGAEYRVERRRLWLVEIKLGVPGEVYPADSVEVALAFFFDARTLSCSRSSGHVVEALLLISGA